YARFDNGFRDSPEWGSSAILLPFYLYKWYGDKQVLSESYEMMCRYASYLASKSQGDILNFGLGDWYDIGPKDPGPSQLTPSGITATAIYYHDLCVLAEIAQILHKTVDEKHFKLLSDRVKLAYNKAFFNREAGQYGTGSQTANAISVYMGLANPACKTEVINHIIQDIQSHNNSITAGDIGFRYLLKVLDDAGRSAIIFDMNSRTDVPGYGFQLAQGATALTESWQGNRISSNNHLMLGHLMEWFYSGLAGIRPEESAIAFRKIIICPEVVGNITATKASYLSPYGMIKNEWHRTAKYFTMETEIPANTTAVIYLPAGKQNKYTEGGRGIENRKDLKFLGLKNGKALIRVGSGKYFFAVR
ncbi:MAG: alpha-L-rhamnosidase, partial [Bacteroidota bacterium]|nr:alpha-L-rhamnosidase [Bacteroidota bacterium]